MIPAVNGRAVSMSVHEPSRCDHGENVNEGEPQANDAIGDVVERNDSLVPDVQLIHGKAPEIHVVMPALGRLLSAGLANEKN